MGNFTILSFCGGGIRGALSAAVLQRLYAVSSSVTTGTSLLCGTSTGSTIVAMILAGKSTSDILAYYENQAAAFLETPSPINTEPGYSIQAVYAGNRELFGGGNPTLASFLPQQVLLTGFYIGSSTNDPQRPILFNNLDLSASGTSATGIADAVTASGAMPGMLGAWKRQVDGAFVNHEPSLAAVCMAVQSGIALEDIYCINVGTGLMPMWNANDATFWGANQWQGGDGNPKSNLPAMMINGTSAPFIDALLNGPSTNLTPMLMQALLGNRYADINPIIPFTPENDVSAVPALVAAGQSADISKATSILQNHWTTSPRPRKPSGTAAPIARPASV